MKLLQKEGISGKKVPMLLLLAVCVIEFLFITQESRFSGLSYYLAENYVIVPCLLLLGWVLREKQTPFVRRRLILAAAAAVAMLMTGCFGTVEPTPTQMPTTAPTVEATPTVTVMPTDVPATNVPEATASATDASQGLEVAPSPSASTAP